ncbi:MAG: pseudouridylate synthase [Prevotellaceae bacterium]|jgi:predicted hotdog family 3-hydroxylacyl-ACP dehydratase|nr:pseudouridylate synthase [Prevotellaceae bacterium]
MFRTLNQPEIDILTLIPQQPPFVMVDKLLSCDYKTTKTALTVRKENIFFDKGVLAEAGLIENIAQTCATRVGEISNQMSNNSVKIGFIGMIRNLEIARLPKAGETLVTQVDLIEEIFQMSLVNATVSIEDEIITSCEMKISITDKEI